MSECANTDVQDLLPELAADRLQGAERARVADHVATCAACAADVELLRLARRVTTRGVPSINVARIVAALPKPPAQSELRPRLVSSAVAAPVAAPTGARASKVRVDRAQGSAAVAPARRRTAPTWTSGWRIAAVAMVAVGGLSVAVLHEMRSTTAPQSHPLTASPSTPVPAPAPAAAPLSTVPGTPGPSNPAVSETPVTGAGDRPGSTSPEVRSPAGVASGLAVNSDISELSDGDVETLLHDMDRLDAVPAADPDPAAPDMPMGVSP